MTMIASWSPNVKHDGSELPPAEKRVLRAGPLSLMLEGADLRYIRLGDREVLRRVYVAVRDPNWGTLEPEYSNMRVDVGEDQFRVEFEAEHRDSAIDFTWHGTIRGGANGTIAYTMDGVA